MPKKWLFKELCFFPIKLFLTLFWAGGGHYGPDDLERPRCFRRVRATTTKIHDFVSVYVWMVPWKSFLGFVFKIFEKRKKKFLTISTSKGPPFGKKIKNILKNGSFSKKHTFSSWIWILQVLSILLRYITYVFPKISIFHLFSYKFLSMTNFIPEPLATKIVIKGGCTWYLWTAKDQNSFLKVHF